MLSRPRYLPKDLHSYHRFIKGSTFPIEEAILIHELNSWCWIDINYVDLRIALAYAPAWLCILISFCIYALSGYDIFRKRQQLRAFYAIPRSVLPIEHSHTNFKTTEVEITSELATLQSPDQGVHRAYFKAKNQWGTNERGTPLPSKTHSGYSVTIDSSAPKRSKSQMAIPIPTQRRRTYQRRKNRTAIEANTAVWAYTKVAILFFISLQVTWVSTFRCL